MGPQLSSLLYWQFLFKYVKALERSPPAEVIPHSAVPSACNYYGCSENAHPGTAPIL